MSAIGTISTPNKNPSNYFHIYEITMMESIGKTANPRDREISNRDLGREKDFIEISKKNPRLNY